MPCLAEKPLPIPSHAYYSTGWSNQEPWRIHKKAHEYVGGRHSTIAHGKFVRPRRYVSAEDKRVVIIDLSGTFALSEEFRSLARKWKTETGFHSSLSKKFTHSAYQRIMAMGKPALPLILRELRDRPSHWFHALRYIAGKDANGVAAGSDTIESARTAWLDWGRKNRYI